MRKLRRDIPPPVVQAPATSQQVTDDQGTHQIIRQERRYTLITPLYGGGAEPIKCDPVTMIRGTEIRGQLRFWWRACFAGRYGSVAEMKKDEDALWGKAYNKNDKSQPRWYQTIQIEVETLPRDSAQDDIPPFVAVPGRARGKRWDIKPNPRAKIPPYAVFPLRPPEKARTQENAPQIPPVYYNVSFVLTISFPGEDKIKGEVEAALWAWETFGGIGARTRRGFGALQICGMKGNDEQEVPLDLPSANNVGKWIKNKFDQFHLSNKVSSYAPTLTLEAIKIIALPNFSPPKKTGIGNTATKSLTAVEQIWDRLITPLQDFRQRKIDDRCIWPESVAIKEVAANIHTYRRDQSKQQLYHFPKAVFGLPIVFHVRDNHNVESLILQGREKGKERLASPLLLRPFACQQEQAVGLVLLLEKRGLPPEGFHLVETDREDKLQRVSLADEKIAPDEEQLLEFLQEHLPQSSTEEIDVIQAFWQYIGGTTS